MTKRVGLHYIPDDADMAIFLEERLQEAKAELSVLITEFAEVLHYGEEEDEPKIFGYARLLNHLSETKNPELVRMLSAAIWVMQEITSLKGKHGQ